MRISDWSSDVCSSDLFERVFDRFGDDDGAGEMHDRLDILISNQFLDECLILNVALHKSDVLRDGPTKASGELVDAGNALSGTAQRQLGMAANIPRPARYQYHRFLRHVLSLPVTPK